NAASREIGAAKKSNEEAAAQALMAEVARLKAEIPALEAEEKKLSQALDDALAEIPNVPLPAPEVPDGKDPSGNIEHHRFGAKRNYGFTPQQHFDLGEDLGQMDFETAARLSGARFVVLKSGLARLERALGQFMLDVHTIEHGYTEVAPPLLVRDEVMFGTAQLPKFADDQFKTENITWDKVEEFYKWASGEIHKKENETHTSNPDYGEPSSTHSAYEAYELTVKRIQRGDFSEKLWLIPTAEVPLTNLVRESIVDEAALPLRFTAGTPCFRAEAGAPGYGTSGVTRPHAVHKVKRVSTTQPRQHLDVIAHTPAERADGLRRSAQH